MRGVGGGAGACYPSDFERLVCVKIFYGNGPARVAARTRGKVRRGYLNT